MTTPPPIPQDEMDALVARIEAAGGEGRSGMIEAAAGGNPALAEEIDRWLGSATRSEATVDDDRTVLDESSIDDPDPTVLDRDGTRLDESHDAVTIMGGETPPANVATGPGAASAGGGTSGDGGFSSRPDTIEGFKVQKLLGAGGMGSVYLCRQRVPEREVAVKLMLPGLGSARAVQRFEFEIETLAKLDHPNVARLYEAGLHDTPKGPTPYVAMEMVRGARTITEYAKEKELDFAARLQLFIRGCRGVAFGHGRGVIHRDLKPPNLLVDESGEPKVIDFGIALAADDESGKREMMGTLQYMAPEQAGREEVGTATDVFSLGLILFEMLTGELPYVVPGANLASALEMITTAEIPSLSAREDQVRLSTRLGKVPPDVDAILAKAMAPNPGDRYENAGELAADLQRFLDDEPTIARPPTFAENLLRIARKHRVEAGLGVAAVIALVVGIIVTTIFYLEAEKQRVLAETNEEIAEEQREVAEEKEELAIVARNEAQEAQKQTMRKLVFMAGLLSKFDSEEISDDMKTDIGDQIGSALSPSIEEAIRPAVGRMLESRVIDPFREELVSMDGRGQLYMTEMFGNLVAANGNDDEAIDAYESVIAMHQEAGSKDDARRVKRSLADILIDSGDAEEQTQALDLYEDVIEFGRSIGSRDPNQAEALRNVVELRLLPQQRIEEALVYLSESEFIYERLGYTSADGPMLETRKRFDGILKDLLLLRLGEGNFAEAVSITNRMVPGIASLHGPLSYKRIWTLFQCRIAFWEYGLGLDPGTEALDCFSFGTELTERAYDLAVKPEGGLGPDSMLRTRLENLDIDGAYGGLYKSYAEMIRLEPGAGWAERRDDRFGSGRLD